MDNKYLQNMKEVIGTLARKDLKQDQSKNYDFASENDSVRNSHCTLDLFRSKVPPLGSHNFKEILAQLKTSRYNYDIPSNLDLKKAS